MGQGDVLTIMRQTIWTLLTLSMPFLLVSLVLGIIIAVFQAATQIHEQTITFVPKLIAIGLMLIFLGSWMMTSLDDFFQYVSEMAMRL